MQKSSFFCFPRFRVLTQNYEALWLRSHGIRNSVTVNNFVKSDVHFHAFRPCPCSCSCPSMSMPSPSSCISPCLFSHVCNLIFCSCSCWFLHLGHTAWTCSMEINISMDIKSNKNQNIFISTTMTSTWTMAFIMDMDLLRGHGHETWIWTWKRHGHGQAALDIYMQHGYGHAA